jgi:hypothetical protein
VVNIQPMEPRKEPNMPDTDAMRRIRELAAKIAVERDVEKFQELVREMNEALEERSGSDR